MNDNHHTDIDQLLDDILFSRSGREKLEQIIEEEKREQLMKDLVIHKAAASAVQRYHTISQVSNIHQLHMAKRNGFTAEDFPPRQRAFNTRNIIRKVWAAAAILIVVPALLYFYIVSSSSSDKLFNEKYHTYHFNVDRSSAQKATSPILQSYSNGDYASAILQYKRDASLNVSETMAAAFAYSQLNQFNQAARLFESVIHNNVVNSTNIYQDEAEYYLALSLLKLKQYDKSYQLFSKIYVDNEHTYNAQVTKWFLIRLNWLK